MAIYPLPADAECPVFAYVDVADKHIGTEAQWKE